MNVQSSPVRVVVAGVAASGKSTIGAMLGDHLNAHFVDGDHLHPPENIAKMSAGRPLDDDDRTAWLDSVTSVLGTEQRIVVACSALARHHRDRLRPAGEVRFVFLELDEQTARARLASRQAHFMGADMAASQFAALEPPADDEVDVVRIDATQSVDGVVAEAMAALSG